MLCGVNHLYDSPQRALGFPQMLRNAGHFVIARDLSREPWWDDSWIRDWSDPRFTVNIQRASMPRMQCCLANNTYSDGCPHRAERRSMKTTRKSGR
jgi:hypothetical protein